jgi:membrane protein
VIEQLAGPFVRLWERLWGRVPPRIRRSITRFQEQNLSDRAAALTYHAVLSLFPALALLVSILGLFGTQETVNGLLDVVEKLGPSSAVDTLRAPINQIANARHGAWLATLVSLVVTLYTASGYLNAFRRSDEAIRGVEQSRSSFVIKPFQAAITLGMVVISALILSVLLLTGPLAEAVSKALGLGDLVLTVWSLGKWPLLGIAVVAAITLLYWTVQQGTDRPKARTLLPGALVASGLWIVTSGGFALYISNFSSYDATYGSLGAIIIFFIWIWLTNAAILLGLVYNDSGPK